MTTNTNCIEGLQHSLLDEHVVAVACVSADHPSTDRSDMLRARCAGDRRPHSLATPGSNRVGAVKRSMEGRGAILRLASTRRVETHSMA